MSGKLSASATAMMSKGPVTVSTLIMLALERSSRATSFVLPTEVSINMYARVVIGHLSAARTSGGGL